MRKWNDGIDSETEYLDELVTNDWCWQWPGWKSIAYKLNQEYHNNRSPSACRSKYRRIYTWQQIKKAI